MIAYNRNWLYNIIVREQADEALHKECITPDVHDAIVNTKEVGFYTPNYFVRIGLAILTLIIASFLMGLMALMFSVSSRSFSGLLIFVGIACYAGSELLTGSKKHYNSGVDNMLIWMAALLLCVGLNWNINRGEDSSMSFSFFVFIVCGLLALRFADMLLSVAATVAFFCFVFYFYQYTGAIARNTTPFLLMVISFALCVVAARAINNERLLLYRSCLKCVNIVALLELFSSGNYYLVRELGNEMFHLGLSLKDPLPLGWFFWSWTFLVPFAYIGFGIRKKNITLIRVGIPLIAVAVLTFRYYHSIMAPEVAMLLGGSILFIVAYSLINYLGTPKNGFTFKPEHYPQKDPVDANITGELFDRSKDTFLQK